MSFNRVILIGTLAEKPDLLFKPTGEAVCDFRLAVERSYTVGGLPKTETERLAVRMVGDEAVRVAEVLKGKKMFVAGRLSMDGRERFSKTIVVAESFQVL